MMDVRTERFTNKYCGLRPNLCPHTLHTCGDLDCSFSIKASCGIVLPGQQGALRLTGGHDDKTRKKTRERGSHSGFYMHEICSLCCCVP